MMPAGGAAGLRTGVVLSAGLLCACGGDVAEPAFEPGEAQLLSSGSPTKDEDPSVLRTRDGTLLVAWFSDRGGNPDIYLTSARGGGAWTAPVRVTTNPGGDFYPTLLQDAQGTIHLVWFRWTAPLVGNIWHNSSPDGLNWDPSTESQVTRAFDVDDWVPTIAEAPDGTLLVYFVAAKRNQTATSDIYLARKPPGADWEAVVSLPGLSSATEHDQLPFATRIGSQLALAWVRHDTTQALPWLNPTSALFYATSPDGVSWSPPAAVTNDAGAVANLFPQIYLGHDGTWALAWLSTKFGSPRVLELPWSAVDRYPMAMMTRSQLPEGYSHRIVATPTPGVYLGVWAQGPEGEQDVYYRFFER